MSYTVSHNGRFISNVTLSVNYADALRQAGYSLTAHAPLVLSA